MKVAYICGCLELGRNGVGDYVIMLSKHLAERSVPSLLLALNDNFVQGRVSKLNRSVKIERLGSSLSWNKRIELSSAIIKDFEADVISIQFVPFAYQKKGLPIALVKWLNIINHNVRYLNSVKWHIMFHELWVADSKANTLKDFILRECQKIIIKKIIKAIKWNAVHTSNIYYQNMLLRIGTQSRIYPIFSNLPQIEKSNRDSDEIIGVYFGNVQNISSSIIQLKILKEKIASELNRTFKVIHIGGNFKETRIKNYFNEVENTIGIEVEFKGFLDDISAAQTIANCHLGLSNYPTELVFKSGSIAAMLRNNIPVILLAPSKEYPNDQAEIKTLGGVDKISTFINQPKNFGFKYGPDKVINALMNLGCNNL